LSGDAHRYGFPRTDLTVTLDGVTIKPALALGGWVAFKPMHDEAVVMVDLVLLESEVNPVMLKLIEGGLEITAVHNHLLRASPATFYLHVGGHGDPAKLAVAIHDALAVSKTPLATPAAPAPPEYVVKNYAEYQRQVPVFDEARPILEFLIARCETMTTTPNPLKITSTDSMACLPAFIRAFLQ
jgi:hypothetical protein